MITAETIARYRFEDGKRRQRVYISGPITGGERNWNQYQANVYHKRLMNAGFAVLNPMPTGVLPFAWEAKEQGGIGHATWLESDFAWIMVSDMILRLPGESKGGDMEVDFANSIGVPVYTIETFPWPAGHSGAYRLAA
jgi:hypothetical protein